MSADLNDGEVETSRKSQYLFHTPGKIQSLTVVGQGTPRLSMKKGSEPG